MGWGQREGIEKTAAGEAPASNDNPEETQATNEPAQPRPPEHRWVPQGAPGDLSSHWGANATGYKHQHAEHGVLSAISLSDYEPTYSAKKIKKDLVQEVILMKQSRCSGAGHSRLKF